MFDERGWDTTYSSNAGKSAVLYAFYQAGAIPGRVACTVFVSNAAIVAGAVYWVTVNPANAAAGVRGSWACPSPTALAAAGVLAHRR